MSSTTRKLEVLREVASDPTRFFGAQEVGWLLDLVDELRNENDALRKPEWVGDAAWVIERGSPAEYLTMQGSHVDDERRVSGYPYWSNHAHAIRFARQRDAMLVLGILRDVNTRLPYRDGWEGLRPNDIVRVTEHQWMQRPAKAD